MYKALLCGVILVLYTVFFGILWLNDPFIQACSTLAILALYLFRLGFRSLLGQIRLLLPFLITLTAIYSLFIILGISPEGSPALAYWLSYGLPRILLLLNSILLFRYLLSYIRFEDFRHLSIHRLKYVILGRILYHAAFHSYPMLNEWQRLIPSEQIPQKGLKYNFNRALCSSLALALYVLGEANSKGEMIDNRILHCYREQK